jgi:hypothetical protein
MFLRFRWVTILFLPTVVYGICTVSQTLVYSPRLIENHIDFYQDPIIFPTLAPSQTTVLTTDLTVSGTWTFISCVSASITRQDIIIVDGIQYNAPFRRFGNFGNLGATVALNLPSQTQNMVFRYTSVTLNMALTAHTADIVQPPRRRSSR